MKNPGNEVRYSYGTRVRLTRRGSSGEACVVEFHVPAGASVSRLWRETLHDGEPPRNVADTSLRDRYLVRFERVGARGKVLKSYASPCSGSVEPVG